MGKVGKISTIKKQYSKGTGSLQAALAENGYQRFPGSSIRISPYFDQLAGKYRNGLDEDASYIDELDKKDQELKRAELRELKEKLERKTKLDLSTTSQYYNVNRGDEGPHVTMYKLMEGDNLFNLDNAIDYINWLWIKEHPLVAPNMEAYDKGDVASSVQFFVNDEDVEADKDYKKKISVNEAIALLSVLPVEKQKKIARLLGLPVTDDTKPIIVYNQLDNHIKSAEIKQGKYKNENPTELFIKFSKLDDKTLTTKDIIEQAIKYGILREKNNKIYDGEVLVAKDLQDYIIDLLDDNNQDELIALKDKLRQKKILKS